MSYWNYIRTPPLDRNVINTRWSRNTSFPFWTHSENWFTDMWMSSCLRLVLCCVFAANISFCGLVLQKKKKHIGHITADECAADLLSLAEIRKPTQWKYWVRTSRIFPNLNLTSRWREELREELMLPCKQVPRGFQIHNTTSPEILWVGWGGKNKTEKREASCGPYFPLQECLVV